MHALTVLVQLVAETGEHGNIMLETIIYPIIALLVFGALALVTFSYRDVANRHAAKAEAYARAHGKGHGAHAEGAESGH